MPNLCCVLDCRTGKGNNKGKVPSFGLPSDKDEPERRKKWICALVAKNNGYLSVSDSTVVCENHWPRGYRRGNQPKSVQSVSA